MKVFQILGFLVLSLGISISILSCNNTVAGNNSSSETTNGFSGIVVDSSGNKVPGAVVTLYPIDFNPLDAQAADSMSDTTNEFGEYFLMADVAQIYNISIKDPNNKVALVQNVNYPNVEDTTILIPETELVNSGYVVLSLSNLNIGEGGGIYIPGTGIYSNITPEDTSMGKIVLNSVPPSVLTELNFQDTSGSTPLNLLKEEIQIHEDIVFTLGPFYNWQYSFKIIINTSSSGAAVEGRVFDFPILIRLDSSRIAGDSNSIFDVATSDGSDLRFSTQNGTELSFEIVDWNRDVKTAEVWVKVDTIFPNNDSQFIYMHTGNENTTSFSFGNQVFESDQGYLAVWHLNEEGNNDSLGYKDATFNLNHLTGVNTSQVSDLNAVVGRGQALDGMQDRMEVSFANSPFESEFTLTHWIQVQSTPQSLEAIFMSYGFIDVGEIHYQWIGDTLRFSILGNNPRRVDYPLLLKPNQWYYLALTYDASEKKLRISVNGEQVMLINYEVTQLIDLSGKYTIGAWDSLSVHNRHNDAIHDEFRISNSVRSEDWIKLSYETQKSGTEVLSIKED